MKAELLLYLFFVLLMIMVFLYLFKSFTKFYSGRKRLERKDISQVGFVVDTFHDLVSKLKEKEKELEILRQKAEDRAVTIEGYNENILQSVPSGVISFDKDLKITKINYAAEKILEVKGESIISKHHSDVLSEPISEILENAKVVERGETRYYTPSGKNIWLGLTFSPLKDRNGLSIGHILVFTDLTQLKAFESQMELRSRLSSLGEISASIAHELRNPMGVIAGYTKLLSKKADTTLKPIVDAISKEIIVMDRIITDFLSFAKPAELNISDINLNSIVKSCAHAVLDNRSDITLNIRMGKIPTLKGDEVLIRQAFTNFMQNAIEAMPHGGTLSITASASTGSAGDFMELFISDTGHGIEENLKDKIFSPFFTTKESGTGLGLAIVHNIIIAHGGDISVESSDHGTVFRVRFPLVGE